MPGRHSPPSTAELEETQQLKRPKRRGPGTRRQKPLQLRFPFEELPLTVASEPTAQAAAPDTPSSPTVTQPESLSTPAPGLPSETSPATSAGRPTHVAANQADTSTAQAAPHTVEHKPPRPGAESSPPGGVITINGIDFHHASEAEFARLLTYYGIEWQYEPDQFPLQWRDGQPTEMFRPDFYLTEYDLYIELTTMRQSLVRRKNRKLRLLRALYPEINIKLLYRRDYQRLLERFGIRHDEIEAELPVYAGRQGDEEDEGEGEGEDEESPIEVPRPWRIGEQMALPGQESVPA